MALEEELVQEQKAPAQEQLTDEEEQDLTIAVEMSKALIDDGGIEIINQAVETSNDPGQVIGQFMMQMVSQLNENLPPDVQLSKRIYFAKDGWIEQVSDFLQEEYGIKRDVMDRAEMFIGAQAEAMAKGAAQQQPVEQGAPAPAPGPAMPQPGVV